MKRILIIICLLINTASFTQTIGIIPTPQEIKYRDGTFTINEKTSIYINEEYTKEVDDFLAIEMLQASIESHSGEPITLNKKLRNNQIQVSIKENIESKSIGEQGYILEIGKEHISIESVSEVGIFYGIQSLIQLIDYWAVENSDKSIEIRCARIVDYPSIEFRGWMDDISRGPIPTMEMIKEQIEILSRYKLNFFNLYTEHVFKVDEHHGIAPTEGLTTAEIKEITEYAKRYHIEVIGNQQCFAHAEKTLSIPYYNNIKDNAYNVNPGSEETYRFYEDIFAEVAPAYSSELFNINCDETDGLGSGYAKRYVDSVGMADAYAAHINRICDILKKYDKRVMMWGDIAHSHPEIIDQLPDSTIIIAWSYVNSDNFNDLIKPFKDSGLDFMIAPGVNCWGQIFPEIYNGTRNIAKFCRDGKINGTKGMMNTCWDDSGENFFNNNWYNLIWGAETSWNVIHNTDNTLAESEINNRQMTFNDLFNIHFFNVTSKEADIAKLYMQIDDLSRENVDKILKDNLTWRSLTNFYPPELTSVNKENNIKIKSKVEDIRLQLTDYKYIINKNSHIIDYAIYSCNRIEANILNNLCRISLYDVYSLPASDMSIHKDKVVEARDAIDTLFQSLFSLRKEYSKLWDMENRGYSKENVLKKFDKIGTELIDIDKKVFITTTTDSHNRQIVNMRTLFGVDNIYFTTDATEPSIFSNSYKQPIVINYPTIIKAKYIEDYLQGATSTEFIVSHKGIGKLHKLNSRYSTYNPAYSGGGESAAIDGIKGSDDYSDGCWQGYQGQDFDIELDFTTETQVNSISARFYNSVYNWIMSPTTLEIYISDNGHDYKLSNTKNIHIDYKNEKNKIITINVSDLQITTRYIKIVAKNAGKLPSWHQAPGGESYIFIDEIVIE